MHISTLFSIALSLSSSALAVPTARAYHHERGSVRHNMKYEKTLGATYFITNKQANTIVVSSINGNGTLTFAKEVATGGVGGSASGAADALFSQDSVVQVDGMLYVVNAGDNSLSLFTVDKDDPTELTLLGKPANTMGQFPVAVAFSEKLNVACVVNSGGQANVACFSVSKDGLAPLPNTVRYLGLNQTNPPTGPANTVSDILFNQDQSQLLVSVKGDPKGAPGFIANFAITGDCPFTLATNAVKSTPDKGVLPFSISLVGKEGDIILNTDAAFGVSVSKIDDETGAITSSSSLAINNQTATCWDSFSPRTGNFYLTDAGTARVSEVNVDCDGPTVKLVATHLVTGIGGRIDSIVGSTRVGDFLYALGAKAGIVNVVKLLGPGKVQEVQVFDAKAAVPDLPISVQGMAVFIKK